MGIEPHYTSRAQLDEDIESLKVARDLCEDPEERRNLLEEIQDLQELKFRKGWYDSAE